MSRSKYNGSRACPRVSDHAVLRFLERVRGLDVEAVRAEILTPEIAMAIKAGAVAVTIKGLRFPVKEGCIVTVLTENIARSRNSSARKR